LFRNFFAHILQNMYVMFIHKCRCDPDRYSFTGDAVLQLLGPVLFINIVQYAINLYRLVKY